MLQEPVARLQESVPASTASPDGGDANRRLLFLAAAIVMMIGYFLPFLLLGSNSYITIHDNLDGEFVEKYLVVATGKALSFSGGTTIDNIMNGLPRATLPSGLNVSVLLFYVFPPVWAYIVNDILVHAIAFCGMFLLLRKHFLTDNKSYGLAVAVSFCFFLVPFYTTYGISVAGQPLLAYAFLNIRSGQSSWKDYFILLFFPLWSDIALTAPFFVTVLVLILLIDWVRSHRFNKRFLASIFLFAFAYLALEFQLINSILGKNTWVSHRTAWNRWVDFSLSSNFKNALEYLFTTQYHSGSYFTLPILVAVGGALVLLIAKRRRAGLLDVLAVGIALICLEYGFYDWIVRWFGGVLHPLRSFNAGRFYFLLPFLFLLLFALCLKELKRGKWGAPIVWCLMAMQVFAILKFNTELKNNARLLTGKYVFEPTFRRFFADDLFTQIDEYIARPKASYRVVSIGIHPSIAQFNGFYTLDAYLSNYPLSYKLQFRPIIAKELDKNTTIRKYFDDWGNRCYVFSSELGEDALYGGGGKYVLHNLQLDTGQLRSMGGEYVISAVEIENSEAHGLRFEKQFSSPGSFWHLSLYSVLPPTVADVAHAGQSQIQPKGSTPKGH